MAEKIGILIGMLVVVVVFMAVYWWMAMLIFGAVAGYFDWRSLGFFETGLSLSAIGIVGSSFMSTLAVARRDG